MNSSRNESSSSKVDSSPKADSSPKVNLISLECLVEHPNAIHEIRIKKIYVFSPILVSCILKCVMYCSFLDSSQLLNPSTLFSLDFNQNTLLGSISFLDQRTLWDWSTALYLNPLKDSVTLLNRKLKTFYLIIYCIRKKNNSSYNKKKRIRFVHFWTRDYLWVQVHFQTSVHFQTRAQSSIFFKPYLKSMSIFGIESFFRVELSFGVESTLNWTTSLVSISLLGQCIYSFELESIFGPEYTFGLESSFGLESRFGPVLEPTPHLDLSPLLKSNPFLD